MKLIKLALLICILLPFSGSAQHRSKARSQKTEAIDKYPSFDNKLAASLWQKNVKHTQFSEEDYSNIIDLCSAAFDYLNADMQSIIDNNASSVTRRRLAINLDEGKASNMETFARTFSRKMHVLAYEEKINAENIGKVVDMLEKRDEFERLNDIIFHQ